MRNAEAPVPARRVTKQKNRTDRGHAACLVLLLSLAIFGIVLYLLCVDVNNAYRPVIRFHNDSTGFLKPPEPLKGDIDINSASAEELQALPGIGPKYSADIVAYRQSLGGFRYPEELMDIRGIAEKRYADLLPYIKMGDYAEQLPMEP